MVEPVVEPTVLERVDDPRVAAFRDLNDHAFRRRIEAGSGFATGIFVVEGWLAVQRLLGSRHTLGSVLVDIDRLDRLTAMLEGRSVPVVAATRAQIAEIVGFDLHRGIVAVAERGRESSWTDVVARSRRLVITEGVNDGENLGVIARNAAALGADALALDPTTCDPLSRRTVRVSTGHILLLPWCRLPLTPGLAELGRQGWRVVALSPSGEVDLAEVAPADRTAVVVGAEGPGLSAATIAASTVVARIPMARGADSINVGSATAIACHQLFPLPHR